LRLCFPDVACSSESSNHLWHSQFSRFRSSTDSKLNKITLLEFIELLGLLGFVESTLVRGWRSTPFEVRGKTLVLLYCGSFFKPRELKILNILKVSRKFERVRPVKMVLGGLLEIRRGLIGLLGLFELLGLLGFIGLLELLELLEFAEVTENSKKVMSGFTPRRKGR